MPSFHEELLAVTAERLSDTTAIPRLDDTSLWHMTSVAELLCWIEGGDARSDIPADKATYLETQGVTGVSVGMTMWNDFTQTGRLDAVPWIVSPDISEVDPEERDHGKAARELSGRVISRGLRILPFMGAHSFVVKQGNDQVTVITEDLLSVQSDEQYQAMERAAKALPMARFCLVEPAAGNAKLTTFFNS